MVQRCSSRVVQGAVLASLVGACLFFYLSREAAPRTLPDVRRNDTWSVLRVRLSQSEIDSLLQATRRSSGEPQALRHHTHAGESATSSPGQETASGQEAALDKKPATGQQAACREVPAACREVTSALQDTVRNGCCDEVTEVGWVPPILKPSQGSFLRNLNLSAYTPETAEYLRRRLGEMVNRTRLVAQGCGLRSQLTSSRELHLLWNTEHQPNLVWCPVFMGAEDGLLFSPPRAAAVNLEERTKVFQSSVRVLVVSDPLLRLLSIFLDKIATDSCPQQFQDMKRKIIKKYRKNNRANRSSHPSFPEFLQYVLDSTRILHTRDDWTNKAGCWTPYWVQCNVCAADYDLVLKMETLEEDQKFILALVNMTEFQSQQQQEEQRQGDKRVPSREVVNRYLRQLDRKQISQVYLRYMLDAEFFGYSSDVHLHLAHD